MAKANSAINDIDTFDKVIQKGSIIWASSELSAAQALEPTLTFPSRRLEYCITQAQKEPAIGTIADLNKKYCWRQRAWAALADYYKVCQL